MFFKDWKDETCYADTATHDLIAWAWEFIRRNEKYQDVCQSLSWPESCSRPERQSYFKQALMEAIRNFGFGAIIDPSYDGGADYFREGLEPVFSPSSLDLARMSSKEKMTVVFDLTKDLQAQLITAKGHLISEQKKIEIMLPNAKQRRREWKQYIRLLDAYNAGIKREEAARFFFPKHSSDPRTAYSDALQQAKLLSRNGYKKLLSAGGYKLMN